MCKCKYPDGFVKEWDESHSPVIVCRTCGEVIPHPEFSFPTESPEITTEFLVLAMKKLKEKING